MSPINDVYDFNQAVGNSFQRGQINEKMLLQAVQHCEEELCEMKDASTELFKLLDDQSGADVSLGKLATIVEPLADAAIDLVYVAINVLYALGIREGKAQELWALVQAANMAKIPEDGFVLRNSAGKVLKPLGWQPANLLPVLMKEFGQ